LIPTNFEQTLIVLRNSFYLREKQLEMLELFFCLFIEEITLNANRSKNFIESNL